MGSKKFTFIELHLDGDTQIGPKAIDDALPGGQKIDVDADEDAETAAEEAAEESGGKGAIGAVIGLVLLVGVAVALRKFRGDDEESELDLHEEPDVVVN